MFENRTMIEAMVRGADKHPSGEGWHFKYQPANGGPVVSKPLVNYGSDWVQLDLENGQGPFFVHERQMAWTMIDWDCGNLPPYTGQSLSGKSLSNPEPSSTKKSQPSCEMQWTASDQREAESQGWGIFETGENRGGRFHLKKVEGSNILQHDREARRLVVIDAGNGDALARKAMTFLKSMSLSEYNRALKETT
jgi:hypothetical protein